MKNSKLKRKVSKVNKNSSVKKSENITISVVLNRVLYNDFNKLAKRQDRKLASFVRMLIKRELADFGLQRYDR